MKRRGDGGVEEGGGVERSVPFSLSPVCCRGKKGGACSSQLTLPSATKHSCLIALLADESKYGPIPTGFWLEEGALVTAPGPQSTLHHVNGGAGRCLGFTGKASSR